MSQESMTEADWARVFPYFVPDEFEPDPSKVSRLLIYKLWRTRKFAEVPMIIHNTWAKDGHSEKSYHYLGQACDFHFGGNIPTLKQFLILAAMGWRGIGYYPFWNSPGWHIDMRLAVPALYWVRGSRGNYHYGIDAMETLLAVGF